MSVGDNFEKFCSNLRMSDETVRKIQFGYRQIAKKITINYREKTSEANYSLYVGSYGRGTEIFVNDIDMVVQLPYSTYIKYDNYPGNGQSALLCEVKEVLQESLRTSVIKSFGTVIAVNLNNGINYRIVPGFINKDRRSFTYPEAESGGSWKIIEPRSEITEMNSMNNITNNNLKILCRMARAWKSTCNVPMSGILIDTLAYKFIKDWEHKDESYAYHDCMSRDFFKYLTDIDASQSYWLAPGSNRCVEKDGEFQDKASQAYNKSLEAINNVCDDTVAKQKWREIYGMKFPG
jgi:hypothetical protein